MNRFAQKFLIGALTVMALAITGCDQEYAGDQASEEKEPYYMEGRSRVKAMDFKGALESFQMAIESNPRSAAAHKELGMLYGRREGDPAAAIYHYEKYLKLRPKAEDADLVQQQISAAKSELAKTVSLGPVSQEVQLRLEALVKENQRLNETNLLLAAETMRWRTHFAAVAGQTNPPPARDEVEKPERRPNPSQGVAATRVTPPLNKTSTPIARQSPSPSSSTRSPSGTGTGSYRAGTSTPTPRTQVYPRTTYSMRTHVVREGETMSSIARRYGVRLSSLTAANPSVDAKRLRAGQALNIP